MPGLTDAEKERIKLMANWCDRASTATVTVGILSPLVGYAMNLTGFRATLNEWGLAGLVILFLAIAAGLHFLGRHILGELDK